MKRGIFYRNLISYRCPKPMGIRHVYSRIRARNESAHNTIRDVDVIPTSTRKINLYMPWLPVQIDLGIGNIDTSIDINCCRRGDRKLSSIGNIEVSSDVIDPTGKLRRPGSKVSAEGRA